MTPSNHASMSRSDRELAELRADLLELGKEHGTARRWAERWKNAAIAYRDEALELDRELALLLVSNNVTSIAELKQYIANLELATLAGQERR